MGFKTYTAITLVVFSSAAFAWQPLTYPVRSQSPYQRSIDTATCYAMANKQTKVNIVHESQLPPKPVATKTSSTGVPSQPPLPPSSFSSAPFVASMPAADMPPMASAPAATAASASTPAGKTTSAKQAGAPGSAPMAASATTTTTADHVASETATTSDTQMSAASSVQLPPLPAPEPPMTQYWAAYGVCMQARGYVVQ